ncbi:MAG TPA: DUF3810 domain-containing protein [Sphingobacterium sp.]|nr:DUF3810 domain-containing protein [Sphingobacterium sp.]
MQKSLKTTAFGISLLCVVIQLFKHFGGAWVEEVYSRKIYLYIAIVKGWIWNNFPFSFGDIFYILVIIVFVFLLIQLIKALAKKNKLKISHTFIRLYICVLSLWVYFDVSWGINYYRTPFAEYLGVESKEIEENYYEEIIKGYIDKTNSLRNEIDMERWDRTIANEEVTSFIQNDKRWTDYLSRAPLAIKYPVYSELISYTLVSGYFNPYTHEAHVNQKMPLMTYPFTVAHELSHKMGVGFEDECNFLAFLYLKDMSDPWYRYAAYLSISQYMLRDMFGIDYERYKVLSNLFSTAVKKDIQEEQSYWEKYSGFYSQISSFFYNFYLLGNNQPEGLKRYSYVSRLIYNWELKR